MSDSSTTWLENLDPETDMLYVTMEDGTFDVIDLVVSTRAKAGSFVRDGGSWFRIPDKDDDTLNDVVVMEVSPDFVELFDRRQEQNKKINIDEVRDFPSGEVVTAAAAPKLFADLKPEDYFAIEEDECPPATQDIAVNLANRENAIKTAAYGPLNPAEPNEEFWKAKGDRWSVTIDDAKKSLCGNCAVFVVTTKMRDCIAGGLEQGGSSEGNAWDAIDTAELGYCEAFDFKCAASRTCDAWVAGGPIADKV